MKINLDVIAGARPNFMKIAPIIKEIDKAKTIGFNINYRLIHTGQHYDASMSGTFFEQLEIPMPDVNFGSGSGTQAEQTAKIMIEYEQLLETEHSKPDLVILVGDVTSTLACAIVAKKKNLKVAHVEGGIRSGDMTMPEEINRKVTDSITDYFFTTSEVANQNLKNEGVKNDKIFFVGNTMIDTLLNNMKKFKQPDFWEDFALEPNKYIVLTMHRPNNVDNIKNLKAYIDTICQTAQDMPIIFPAHPRTVKMLQNININYKNLHIVSPLGYLDFNFLVKNAKGVITDSGGVTEETTVMKIPCITLRDNTERPETVTIGTNELVGTNPKSIPKYITKIKKGEWKEGRIPELWDGKAGERIIKHILTLFIYA